MYIEKSRKTYLDILRITSIIAVIACHTLIYRYHTLPAAGNLRPVFIAITFLLKTGVPTMYMISGALLLPKEESLSTLVKKRVFKYIVVLFAFSLISYIYSILKSSDKISWWVFFANFYSYGQVDSYWFLYQYIAYLISLPFLRKLAHIMKKNDFIYMFILWGIIKSLDFLAYRAFGIPIFPSSSFNLFIMEHQVFFPLAGYFIDSQLNNKHCSMKNVLFALLVTCIAIIITSLVQNHYWNTSPEPEQEAFLDSLVFVPTLFNFFFICILFSKLSIPIKTTRILSWISSCTFNIYLLHHIYLYETALIGEYLLNNLGIISGSFVWVFVVFFIGAIISSILKKVPYISKLI